MFQKISLRTKAIILAIALGTLPVIGCGAAAYYLINKSIVNSTINFQQLRANSLSDKVNRFLFERYGDIQVIANLPVLNNPKGTEKMTFQEKQNILNKYVQIYGVYDSIAAFDLKGNLILQSFGKLFSNHKDQDYFQQVLQTGLPVITNPEISKSTGEIVIYFAAPVKDVVTGKMIGVVRSRMPIKFLEAVAAEFTADQSEWHLIDNSSGEIFAAQEKRQVGRNANLDFPVFAQMAAAKKMNTTIAVEQYDQAEELLTYTPFEKLEGLPQLNWSLIFAQDTGKAFATQKQVLWTLMLGTGVTALVGSGLAVMLVGRTTKLIQEIASAIASSAIEIATTVEQQERTVRQQAGSVHETTTTMDELAASSQQSAEQAEASAAGTRQALAVAEAGNQAVQHALDEMSLLKVSVSAIAEQILHLSEQTTQIGSISAVVGDLASQTNMLALNAAVEAARAGENGKGFGVVAGEIRKLADQSKKSAEKINALVTDIQSSINTTVIVTDEGTKKVDQGIELAQGTAVTFTEMADSINNVFLNSQQISLSAKQQAIAVQQVVEAMNAINSGARENASGITQVKASTQQLNQVAHKLQTVV